MKPIRLKLRKLREALESRGLNPEIPIKTLPEVNRKVWGLHRKKLTIIASRTGIGKSAMATQLAWDFAKQGIPTLFVSLEMYEEDIMERLFCLEERIDNYELLCGKFAKYSKEWEDFEKVTDELPLVVTDMLGKSWQEVDAYLKELVTKPTVIIIDHLQEARGVENRRQKDVIEEYLKKLRIMAIRDNFALVICSQINRSSQEEKPGSPPQLHHLKESGYIEESADVIWLLHWEWHHTKKGDPNKFSIHVAKNRNGRTGWVEVRYRPENYWFYEEVKTHDE